MSAVRDPHRLAALEATQLLDAAREETFDRLTRLASRMLRVPCSVMTLVDDDRQFFLSEDGMREDLAVTRETPLSHSFCKHVVDRAAPLVVRDAREDELVADNLAVRDLGVVAYCGVPLRLSDGQVLGAFCAIEPDPREWSTGDVELLADLAALATEAIELRETRQAERPTLTVVPEARLDLRREALLAALPGAADRGEVEIHYEPLVHLASREVWGFAAQPRWNVAGHGVVDHQELRAVSAAGGDAIAVGEWVLARACADVAAWRAAASDADALPALALPITAEQLSVPRFAGLVAHVLEGAGLPPRALTLLVDERTLVGARVAHRRALAELRDLGIAIALTDFGAGDLTLTELADLPVDVVALDVALATGARTRLTGAVLAALERLGLGTIGTGVGTEQDAVRLAELGCVTACGPHLGPPLEAGAVSWWLTVASPRADEASSPASPGR